MGHSKSVYLDYAPPEPLLIRPNSHLPALDAVRGIAILMVLGFHFTMLTANDNRLSMMLCKLAVLGRCGVDLFFVLSGFLITGLLFDAKGSTGFFRTFYARRVLRIFPLYLVSLALWLWVLPLFGIHVVSDAIAQRQGWLWLHSTNIGLIWGGPGYFGSLGHLWSLSIEEHFYLLWPLVVFFFDRRVLIRICACVAAAALLSRVIFMSMGDYGDAAYLLTPNRIDPLALGGMVALIARSPGGLRPMIRPAKWIALISFALLTLILLVRDRFHAPEHDDKLMPTIGYTVLASGFAACIILAVSVQKSSKLWPIITAKPLRLFGKFSYALYIWHLFVFETILAHWPMPKEASMLRYGVQYAVVGTVCMALSLAVAWISWHVLEKRFLALKRHFSHEPPTHGGGRATANRPTWRFPAPAHLGGIAAGFGSAIAFTIAAIVWLRGSSSDMLVLPACCFWTGVGIVCVLGVYQSFGKHHQAAPASVAPMSSLDHGIDDDFDEEAAHLGGA